MEKEKKEFVESILFYRSDVFTYSDLEEWGYGFNYKENGFGKYKNFTIFIHEDLRVWAKRNKVFEKIDWAKETNEIFNDALNIYKSLK